MNDRKTPETDAFSVSFKSIDDQAGKKKWVPADFASRLERERDDMREKLSATWQSLRDLQDEVLRLTFENRELRNLINE